MNSNEWEYVLGNIIPNARRLWQEANPDRPFSECKFMYDNPGFHNLDAEQKGCLLEPGVLLDDLEQLQRPSPYSGDFMQCIEHVHGWICAEWYKQCFRDGIPQTNEQREADLQYLFYSKVTPATVRATVERLWRLLEVIVQENTGGYAPTRFV